MAPFLNKWSHVAGVYDAALNTGKVYIGGALVQQETIATGVINYSNHGFWTNIGAGRTTLDFFKGAIDEVRIYKKALTDSEVETLAK